MKQILFEKNYVTPSKIVCVGRNYVEHIKELNNKIPKKMVLFNKPNSAISDKLYYFNDFVRYEGELCFLIKNNSIIGLGFGLDLTNAKEQEEAKKNGLPWERAKAFDNSAVFSKFIAFDGDLKRLSFKLFINDKVVQEGNYDLMIYKPKTILQEISSFQTLQDYDIIMSGTPKGVGTYKRGDIFRGEIFYDEKTIIKCTFVVL